MSISAADLLNQIEQQVNKLTQSEPVYVLDISELRKVLPKRGITPVALAESVGGVKISETEFMFKHPYGPEQMARKMLKQARDLNKTEDAFQQDYTKAGISLARKGTSTRRMMSPEASALMEGFGTRTGNPIIDDNLEKLNTLLKRAAVNMSMVSTKGRGKKGDTTLGYTLKYSSALLQNLPKIQQDLKRTVENYARNDAIQTGEDILLAAIEKAFGKTSVNNRAARKSSGNATKVLGVQVSEAVPTLGVSKAGRFTNNGKFVSSANIMTILNNLISLYVHRHMGRPELIWRTGRFANSVKIVGLTATRAQAVQATYTYMLYPYQTFEPGFKQGFRGYDPRRLITKAIRAMMAEVFSVQNVSTIREA